MNGKAVLMKGHVILGIASLSFLGGCGGGRASTVNNNPAPTITTISPNSAMAGGAAFTLTIDGTNFTAASAVDFGGTARTTTFVSATQLTAAIPAAAITSTGTATVTVTNPAPGGGTSNAQNFTITSATNPVPMINLLSPSCGPKGQQVLNPFANGQLLVNGQNFVANSVVRWNGNDRPTTFANSGQLTAQISTSDIGAVGTAAVTVFNPAPGGGNSNTSTFKITAGGVSPQSIAVDPNGKLAYVANVGCEASFGNASMYTIDSNTGILASIAPPMVPPDEGTRFVVVDHSGNFALVANWGEGDTAGSLSTYTIDATTGALMPKGTIYGSCPGLCAPWSVAVHPSAEFAYVADEGGFAPTGVSMFAIDATTGALTSIGTIGAGGRAYSLAVDPSGKFAYVANWSDPPGSAGSVSTYTIDPMTGALASTGLIATGTNPVSVAVDPSSKFAYVANQGSNDISTYSINTNGALTSVGTIPAGSAPTSIAIHPTGNFAYVTNFGSNDVSIYSIDSSTGALTSKGTIPTELSPTSIAIHPSGMFAYVANSGSNSVSMYSIDVNTGALTLIKTIGT